MYVHASKLPFVGNAAPVLDQKTGVITLVFCRDNTEVFYLQSSDDGVTWKNHRNITAVAREPQWGFTGSGPPGGIQLPSGRLVICKYCTKLSYVVISLWLLGVCTVHIIAEG